jgi:phosphoglycolate phosphatase
LNKYGISKLFKNILVTEQKHSKIELIRPFLQNNQDAWIIGDTGNDILVGKELKIKTAAVNSGFMSHERLIEYDPDILIEKVTDFQL